MGPSFKWLTGASIDGGTKRLPGFGPRIGRIVGGGIQRVPMWVRVIYLIGAVFGTGVFGLALTMGTADQHVNWLGWLVLVLCAILLGAIWPVSLPWIFTGGFRTN